MEPKIYNKNLSGLSTKSSKFEPSSPTDNMLSPVSKRLLRRNSKIKPPEVSLDNWTPNDRIRCILGSSSRIRSEILQNAGWRFSVRSPDIDEKAVRCEDIMRLPVLIAKSKATAICDKLEDIDNETIVITCDQIILFHGAIREKPVDMSEAASFISSYSGESVQTITAVVATHLPSRRQSSETDIATVYWRDFSSEDIENMLLNEHVLESAGGFLIEDINFARAIERIVGDRDSVLGLPMRTTIRVVKSVLNPGI